MGILKVCFEGEKAMPLCNIEKVSSDKNIYTFLAEKGYIDGACGGIGRCGKCRIKAVYLPIYKAEREFFNNDELEAGWRLACLHLTEELKEVSSSKNEDVIIMLPRKEKSAAISDKGFMRDVVCDGYLANDDDAIYGMAVDIGTTTLAAALVELKTGQIIRTASCLNDQKKYGQDVITRIGYTMENEDGLSLLREAISKDIRMLKDELCGDMYEATKIASVCVAGNSTMIHLLGGVDPAPLATFPFVPSYFGELTFAAKDIGLQIRKDAVVFCIPHVSSYVGGDITSGMLAVNLRELDGNVLFIDIGTNGEMVLKANGKMYSCSCAAGPALEGMDISCGMRAADGAIEGASLRDGKLLLEIIGDKEPSGICGSGLLSLVSEFVDNGVIEPAGRIVFNENTASIVEVIDKKKRIIVDREHGIYLSQKDIRQVQLAKGAILAGIRILLSEASMKEEELDKVLVAGQFGLHLNAKSLTHAGLMPKEFEDKIDYVGNTSLSGAIISLLSNEERKKANDITKDISYLELSVYPGYEKLLMDAMRF